MSTMQPISIQQLVIDSLATLSNDLHNKVDQTLSQLETQQSQTIDSLIQKQLALMLPNLYQQLLTHLNQQIDQKTQQHNQQITDYLDELDKLQKSEVETLKKGQEEFQNLQDKIQSTLSHLDSIQPVDESKFESSLTDLKNSIQMLKTSTSESNSEQQSLESLISELEKLKTDMTTKVSELTQLQSDLANYAAQLRQLLG
ncbi:hypothetical protein CYJ96_11080 [Moraxella osloensis]|uniref:Uncharacterized protein n=1 Tax=Faucicola osloensis TaxID=34062 RepID=A0A2I1RFS6_FAUOS|nr:hypothetical protein CYJ96_11080 [Moraxella osloensis]